MINIDNEKMILMNFAITINISAVRSGDYFMFDELDVDVELKLFNRRPSSVFFDSSINWKSDDKPILEQVYLSV